MTLINIKLKKKKRIISIGMAGHRAALIGSDWYIEYSRPQFCVQKNPKEA